MTWKRRTPAANRRRRHRRELGRVSYAQRVALLEHVLSLPRRRLRVGKGFLVRVDLR